MNIRRETALASWGRYRSLRGLSNEDLGLGSHLERLERVSDMAI